MLVSANVCGVYASFKLFLRVALMKCNMALVLPHKRTMKFFLFNVNHILKCIPLSIKRFYVILKLYILNLNRDFKKMRKLRLRVETIETMTMTGFHDQFSIFLFFEW